MKMEHKGIPKRRHIKFRPPREITQKEAYKIGEVYPEYRRIKQENRISMSAMLSPVQMDSWSKCEAFNTLKIK